MTCADGGAVGGEITLTRSLAESSEILFCGIEVLGEVDRVGSAQYKVDKIEADMKVLNADYKECAAVRAANLNLDDCWMHMFGLGWFCKERSD